MSLILISTLLAVSILYALWLLEEGRMGGDRLSARPYLRMGRMAAAGSVKSRTLSRATSS